LADFSVRGSGVAPIGACHAGGPPNVSALVRTYDLAIKRVLLGHTIAFVCYDCH